MNSSQGGMYELLKLIVILLAKQEYITNKELQSYCKLSSSSITNNLTRLVKINILIKKEEKIITGGRRVIYKLNINHKTIDFLIKTLY